MTSLDGLWHLVGFIAPTLFTGCMTALMAKAVWRKRLDSTSVAILCTVTAASAALGFGIASIVLGHDGRIAAYLVMVLSAALFPWWRLCRA